MIEIENHHLANLTTVAGKYHQQMLKIVGKCIIGNRMFIIVSKYLSSEDAYYKENLPAEKPGRHHLIQMIKCGIYKHYGPPDLKMRAPSLYSIAAKNA